MTTTANGDLANLLERVSRILQNAAHAHGLKPAQWDALRYLKRANRFSRTPGALTSYLGITKGTVSQTLLALEKKELIKKGRVAGDRRAVRLELTDAGHQLLESDPLAELNAAIGAISPQSALATTAGTRDILTELLQRRDGRPFGVCRSCRYFAVRHEKGRPHYCQLLAEPLGTEDSESICAEQLPAVAK